MSRHDWAKRRRLSEAFHHSGHIDSITKIAGLLQYGTLAAGKMDLVDEAVQAKIASTREILHHHDFNASSDGGRQVKQRMRNLFSCYLDLGHRNFHHFIPTGLRISYNFDHLLAYERTLPLEIPADHVEERYEQRNHGQLLSYEDGNFMRLAGFALLLATVLEKDSFPLNTNAQPIVLPHPDGLFLGVAEQRPSPNLHKIHLLKSHSNPSAAKILEGMPLWEAPNTIIMKTFIGTKDMFDEQILLHHSMMALMEEKDVAAALMTYVEAYTLGSPERARHVFRSRYKTITDKHVHLDHLPRIQNRLADIVHSMPWQIQQKRAQRHLEEHLERKRQGAPKLEPAA